jgi:hypothetical protein
MSGELREAQFKCHERNECWHDKVLPTTDAINGTKLAMVPTRDMSSEMDLFYQQEGAKVVAYKEKNGEGRPVWENGKSGISEIDDGSHG